MHPTLIKLGPIQITGYGLMLAISFIVGILVAVKRAKNYHVDPNRIMDLALVVVVSSIAGSRILYVVFHLDEFRGHWFDTFNPFQSTGQIGIAGLTLLGGLLLSIATGIIYLRLKKLPFLRFADVIIPSVALGIFITRIGCFLNGCCFGTPTTLPWGIVFPSGCAAHAHYGNIPLHPAQLYSSLYGLIIFVILLLLGRISRFDGYIFFVFLILYGLARFLVDLMRYYEPSMVFARIGDLELSVNQGISILMLVGGVVLLWVGYRRVQSRPSSKKDTAK